jgi:Na+/melibiose symporter-like transporter
MEPLMGGMSDQAKRWVGTRFPFISVGVILSSVLFIAIPTVVIFGNPTDALRWVLPIVLIAWALAMTVFRSPAVSLLNQYAAPEALPLAASLLTLSGGLIGAFASFSHQLVLGWGPAVTFAIASFVLLGAVALLRFVHPPETSALSVQSPESSQLPTVYSLLTALQLIFVTGISVTWGSRFLMNTLQKVVKNQLSAADVEWVMFAVAIALALAALPAGALAVWLGNQRAMLIGIGATVGLMWLIALIPSWVIVVIVVIALVAAFSLIVNGVIPYALSLVPPQRSGVGVGIYFAGAAASAGLFEVAFPQSSLMTPIIAALLGTLAFLAAGLCIVASTKIGRSPSHR